MIHENIDYVHIFKENTNSNIFFKVEKIINQNGILSIVGENDLIEFNENEIDFYEFTNNIINDNDVCLEIHLKKDVILHLKGFLEVTI